MINLLRFQVLQNIKYSTSSYNIKHIELFLKSENVELLSFLRILVNARGTFLT